MVAWNPKEPATNSWKPLHEGPPIPRRRPMPEPAADSIERQLIALGAVECACVECGSRMLCPAGKASENVRCVGCIYKIARCEVCGVVMQPDEIAYSGPRFCVDCACEHEENIREAERMEREGSK